MRRNQYTMVPASFEIYPIPNTQYPRRSARVLGIYPNTYPVQNLGRVPPDTYPPECKTCRVHNPAPEAEFPNTEIKIKLSPPYVMLEKSNMATSQSPVYST